ncbi:ammonium transporter [Micromonospora sp. NPDC005174]|uniref:ammonium transporter n=1 Tax=unclassified Micromonospora TaxID=2617518 RepID=UPI0033AB0E70
MSQAGLDGGATAWVLVSAVLVLLMTPGVAFFYGGMVRASNVAGTVMQGFMTIGVVTVLWLLLGYSLAFGPSNSVVGGWSFVGLTDLAAEVPGIDLAGVPPMAFVLFQMMFAVITPALILGAGAERWRFSASMIFVALWSLLVYAPVAHWLFSPLGWAHQLGALDFAGGAVVHANAGAAALVVAARLGRRARAEHRPHNLPMMLLGTALLWVGWFGFNGGSALRANDLAVLAVINTQAAAAVAMIAWALVERLRFGKPTTLGAASGAVAGLVAITPAAGYVTPTSALLIGLAAGVLCHFAVGLKALLRLDDALDVAAVHLGGGLIGALSVGLFATASVNPGIANGLFYGGGYRLLGVQALSVGVVVVYSAVVSLIIMVFVSRIRGNRIGGRAESVGVDLSQHGETPYAFPSTPQPAVRS